jgi:hypothetical protein
MLENHSTPLPNLGEQVTTFFREHGAYLKLIHMDLSRIGLKHADDVFQGDGLPHAALSKNEENLAFFDLKGNSVEDFFRTK